MCVPVLLPLSVLVSLSLSAAVGESYTSSCIHGMYIPGMSCSLNLDPVALHPLSAPFSLALSPLPAPAIHVEATNSASGHGFRHSPPLTCACVRLGVGEGEERLRPAKRVRAPLGTTATAWRVAMCEQCKARPFPAATATAQVVEPHPVRSRRRLARLLCCAVRCRALCAFFVARRRAGGEHAPLVAAARPAARLPALGRTCDGRVAWA